MLKYILVEVYKPRTVDYTLYQVVDDTGQVTGFVDMVGHPFVLPQPVEYGVNNPNPPEQPWMNPTPVEVTQ